MRIGMGCKAQTTDIALASYGEDLQRRRPPEAATAHPRGDCEHVLKDKGAIVPTEAQTFTKKALAQAWIKR